MTCLRWIHKNRAEPATCLLDADDEVDTVGAGMGLVVVLADFEVADRGSGSGLGPHAHWVEVEDLALVTLLPQAAKGNGKAGNGDFLRAGGTVRGYGGRESGKAYCSPVEAINGLPFDVHTRGQDAGLPDHVEGHYRCALALLPPYRSGKACTLVVGDDALGDLEVVLVFEKSREIGALIVDG